MQIITLDAQNLAREHICCAISDKKGETCVATKKAWLAARFADGLTFKKMDLRGKAFIEYIPAARAWAPIQAEGYMFINCLWVAGQHKGKGYANALVDACIQDARARGCVGLCALASDRKRPFLSEPGFLKHRGFAAVDQALPHFVLYSLPFDASAPTPHIRPCARDGAIDQKGMVLYYSDQCPHTAKYVPIACEVAAKYGFPLEAVHFGTYAQAQQAPCPFTTYAFFDHGAFVTNEILSPAKLEKYMQARRAAEA